jgi:hypothetical protein
VDQHENKSDVIENFNCMAAAGVHGAQPLHLGLITPEEKLEELQQGVEDVYGQKNL